MNNVAQKIQASSPDEVTIIVGGQRIEQFQAESILLSIDNLGAGFSFTAPFFPDTKEYRDIFRPFTYQPCQIYIGQTLKINGTVEKIAPTSSETENTVNVQGRSKTGVIVDCSFTSDGQKEFTQAGLEEIATTVVAPFGLEVSFPDGAGAIFEQAGPDSPTTKVFDFLQNLARQRGLLMGQTANGQLLFRKPKTTGSPVAELIEGQQGIIISAADYDGTGRFSLYEVYGQEPGKNDNFASLEDTSIPAYRPKAASANDTNQGNIEDAAKWVAGGDIAAKVRLPLGYEGWLRPDGVIWSENELILVTAPSLMVYNPTLFLIKSVTFNRQESTKTVSFDLTLPEAYTGKIPQRFPWDE